RPDEKRVGVQCPPLNPASYCAPLDRSIGSTTERVSVITTPSGALMCYSSPPGHMGSGGQCPVGRPIGALSTLGAGGAPTPPAGATKDPLLRPRPLRLNQAAAP